MPLRFRVMESPDSAAQKDVIMYSEHDRVATDVVLRESTVVIMPADASASQLYADKNTRIPYLDVGYQIFQDRPLPPG